MGMRRILWLALALLAILPITLILMTLFGARKADPDPPRFVPGQPKSIAPYTRSHYTWNQDIPFSNGKLWLWGIHQGTNNHSFLYDLDQQTVLGELFAGASEFSNGDGTKLLCRGSDSPMVTLKSRLLASLSRLSFGRIRLPPTNRVETFWILNLKNNSARRIGDVSQWPGAGSGWHQSPGLRYGYTVPSFSRRDAEFFLCDLDQAAFQKIEFDGRLQGWWDDHTILMKDPDSNFVLFDIVTRKTTTLFSAAGLTNSLRQMGLDTSLTSITAFPTWNGRQFDFYVKAPTNWIAGYSYLLKVDRASNVLVLLDRNFDFHWLGNIDPSGTHYMFDGESGAPGTVGNGGVFLSDLKDNTTRTILTPDNKGQYAISRFYRDSVIYFTNRCIWRIDLNGSNNVQILPPRTN
jgi:hypothetical protein